MTPHRGADPVVHPQMLWRHAGAEVTVVMFAQVSDSSLRIVGASLRSGSHRAYSYPYI
jgi:hypothetical protein